jgi:hypothetical protein
LQEVILDLPVNPTYVLEVCINVSNWSCHFNSRFIAIRKLSIVAKRTPEDGTH